MTNHLEIAEHHRDAANAEVAKQGSAGVTSGEFAASRSAQMRHTDAAHRADAAHAASIGKQVVYTPIGNPVYR